MIIFWRGWGALVLFAPLLWILAAVMILIGIDYHESDADMAAATIYRLCAAGLAVATLNLWMVVRYRERVAPGVDQFGFIPMKFWTPVIGLFAMASFVASFIPAALHAL